MIFMLHLISALRLALALCVGYIGGMNYCGAIKLSPVNAFAADSATIIESGGNDKPMIDPMHQCIALGHTNRPAY